MAGRGSLGGRLGGPRPGTRRVGVSRVAAPADAQILYRRPTNRGESGLAPGFPALLRRLAGPRIRRLLGVRARGEGAAEAMVEVGPTAGTWRPGVIVEEAGGRFTDLLGKRTIHSGNAIATNGILHDEIVARLRRGGISVE